MKSKNHKIYQIDGKEYEFNHNKFSELCLIKSSKNNQKKSSVAFLLNLVHELNYEASDSTIKGWMYGNNSPATIDMIEKVANVFDVETNQLLIEVRKDKEMSVNNNINIIDEATREAVKKIYEGFVDIIEGYSSTNGFAWTTEDVFFDELCNPVDKTDTLQKYLYMISEQEIIVKKSRVYIAEKVVGQLLGLINIINVSSDPFISREQRLKDSVYSEEDFEQLNAPSEYEIYLDGKKTNYYSETLFIKQKVNSFYNALNEILIDYLP